MADQYTLVYHPNIPNIIVPAVGTRELYKYYRAGYKKVCFSRIGTMLRRYRKKLNISQDTILNILEDKGIYIKPTMYSKLESGNVNHSLLSVMDIKRIAELLHLRVEDLIQRVND